MGLAMPTGGGSGVAVTVRGTDWTTAERAMATCCHRWTARGQWPAGHTELVPMPTRALGRSGIEVSRISLGSWRTYERLTRDEGLAVMRAARQAGITFLDDARYDDETGTAPIPTGYSEVVFG